MTNSVNELSNKAPIILTWVPRVHGASLPNGKNSTLNYLEIIKNHKLTNKEERDIYLVINGPGFEENQIDSLKHELKGIEGVHVIDLHQYDWSEIDTGWKIDGKDISIKDFFKNMYNMSEEQRTYFAVEIDTFRLVALALLKQFTGHEGGIYIDFDSLKAIDSHIGKDITIPEGILLGNVIAGFLDQEGNMNYKSAVDIKNSNHYDEYKNLIICTNNDCIVINNSSIAVNILSDYKDRILSQKEACNEVKKRLSLALEQEEELAKGASLLTKDEELKNEIIKQVKEKIKKCVSDFESNGIQELYNIENFQYINTGLGEFSLNSAQMSTGRVLIVQLCDGEKVSKCPSFSFNCNNGNYVFKQESDLSWMKGKDLYRERVDNKLEGAEVDRVAMGELSLI
ncbi:hypothetical protein C1A_832 [Wolbachia endosymbiont of Culex quinquefasciatus JHB]|uniref:Jg7804 protein n=1 Tax=Pararge aegeria aegeria TaxID=348720 RepID=A0A8S4QKS5_9NEOP|nr:MULTISPECIES: hypothetical protein [unclassified Wolbachia]EEB55810.1 hypothetical protein C1A_832 [Wolbachia endosymbiont of Culex quinquefasciatus JHB]CAH2210628.1 jg7804 [Pararge aegeria aegeria]CAQ55391.1 Hypothetical protein WP1283 [Wolbachia endosymbiont of Culex quinquefasciatus Pel]CQD06478.1 Uncharacterised protein [Wolbachia endosymbiont wPip_Mol of Culex molestus]